MDEDLEPPPPPLPVKQSRQMSMHIEPGVQVRAAGAAGDRTRGRFGRPGYALSACGGVRVSLYGVVYWVIQSRGV